MCVYNIVFQSSSIDGWFSGYLTGQLAAGSDDLVFFHPIDARTPDTWPAPEKLAPASIAPESMFEPGSAKRQKQTNGKAFCFFIDCTPTSPNNTVNSEYLLDIAKDFNVIIIDNNPIAGSISRATSKLMVAHNSSVTTIQLVWQHFGCACASMPDWVQQVDRIESWKMERDDFAIREKLLEICRLPTMGRLEEAMTQTTNYLAYFKDEEFAVTYLAEAEEKHKNKIAGFAPLLAGLNSIELTVTDCGRWGFPLGWAGMNFLYVDTTGSAPDSSELAAYALAIHGGDAFVNFRKRVHPGGEVYYVYSARASTTSSINLVEAGSPFKGFERSAGASISALEYCVPFVK